MAYCSSLEVKKMVDKRRMGEILVELGLIDEYNIRHALDVAKREGLKLGEAIIRLGYLGEDQVLGILKNLTSIPVLDVMYELPSHPEVKAWTVTEEAIRNRRQGEFKLPNVA
mgnify:CR=1 FL=1